MSETPKKLTRTQQTIQNAIEHAEANKRREMMRIRIELARKGMIAFEQHSAAEAAVAFKTYIRILEELKEVNAGGLHPGLFDKKKDLSELLLISGVYWDLMKLYDRTKSAEKRTEFLHYTEKFIAFAKDMPFQSVCAETLRKYLSNKNPFHKDEFKNAYKILGNSKCYIATALLDVTAPETFGTLREFRDQILLKYFAGKAFVSIYYKVGPALAKGTDLFPESIRRKLGAGLDRIARLM